MKEPLQMALLHCISNFKRTFQSAWFPQDAKSAILLARPNEFDTRLAARPFSDYYPGYTGANEAVIVEKTVSRVLGDPRHHPFASAVIMTDAMTPKKVVSTEPGQFR